MNELEISVDLSLVFQALLSFEGLFIWKISPWVFAKYRIDNVGNPKLKEKPKEILDRWWRKKSNNESFSAYFSIISLIVYLFIIFRALINYVTEKLKYTPYITVILYSMCVLLQSLYHPNFLKRIFTGQNLEFYIFYFICFKLICIFISYSCNWFYFHLDSFKLPNEETLQYVKKHE